MSSSSMSKAEVQETKDHPERFATCPEGNFHRITGDDYPPLRCFCCDANGHPIYQLAAAGVIDGKAQWMHIGFGLFGQKAENQIVEQKHFNK